MDAAQLARLRLATLAPPHALLAQVSALRSVATDSTLETTNVTTVTWCAMTDVHPLAQSREAGHAREATVTPRTLALRYVVTVSSSLLSHGPTTVMTATH